MLVRFYCERFGWRLFGIAWTLDYWVNRAFIKSPASTWAMLVFLWRRQEAWMTFGLDWRKLRPQTSRTPGRTNNKSSHIMTGKQACIYVQTAARHRRCYNFILFQTNIKKYRLITKSLFVGFYCLVSIIWLAYLVRLCSSLIFTFPVCVLILQLNKNN